MSEDKYSRVSCVLTIYKEYHLSIVWIIRSSTLSCISFTVSLLSRVVTAVIISRHSFRFKSTHTIWYISGKKTVVCVPDTKSANVSGADYLFSFCRSKTYSIAPPARHLASTRAVVPLSRMSWPGFLPLPFSKLPLEMTDISVIFFLDVRCGKKLGNLNELIYKSRSAKIPQ